MLNQSNFRHPFFDGKKCPFLYKSLLASLIVLLGWAAQTEAQVSVTATAGTMGPTAYTTLKDAFDAINANTHQGDVTVSITGNTTETASAVLNAATYTSVTISPSGGAAREISGNIAGHLIDLDGADNVTINGLNTGGNSLTITNTATGASSAVRFINDATNNLIAQTTLRSAVSTSFGVVFFSTGTTTGNDNNTVSFCEITAPNATDLPLNGIFSLGSSATVDNSMITISNNRIFDFFQPGASSNGLNINSFNSDWTIDANNLYQTAPRTTTASNQYSGIFISNSGGGYVITNNAIGGSAPGATGSAWSLLGAFTNRFVGISVAANASATTSIQGNNIANFNTNTTSATSTLNGNFCGIWVSGGSANIGDQTANLIGSNSGNGSITVNLQTGTVGAMNAISYSGAGTANIRSNRIGSINLTGSTVTNAEGFNGILVSSGTPIVRDNIIGSSSTANSVNSSTVVTTNSQVLNGIQITAATATDISNNTIANINQAGTTTGSALRGIIFLGTGVATINGNTIFSLSGANTNAALAGGVASVLGILNNSSSTGAGVQFNNNLVHTLSATNTGAVATNVIGISTSNPTNPQMVGNMVYNLQNASTMTTPTTPPMAIGISVRAALTSGTFFNNMVSLGSSQTTNTQFVGIINSFTTAILNIHHNTVVITGTAAGGALPSFGFLRGNNTGTAVTSPVNIRNNLFINERTGGTGKHYAIANQSTAASATGWPATASDFNVLNAAGTTVGLWGSTDQSFADWKTTTGGDNSSFSGVPAAFVNVANGDLHLAMGLTPTVIESGGAGTGVTGVTTDKDGQTRPGPAGSVNGGASAPDIGADEFDGVPLDVLPPTITYLPLTNNCNTGSRTLTATITDPSGVPTAGIGLPVLYWRINAGAYTAATATSLGGNQYQFTLGAGSVLSDMVSYYIVAQDLTVPPNVGAFPSGGAGGFTPDPPAAATPPTTPSQYTNIASLTGGTYTVGVGGDYTTLTAAVADYNLNCIGGAIVFELIDATYPSETFPITVLQNPGASAVNSLTIRPAIGVSPTVSGTVTGPLIRLFGNHVTIDGSNSGGSTRDLTLAHLGTTSPTVVLIGSTGTIPVNNVAVKNCTVINGAQTASAIVVSDGATTGNAGLFNNITIQNNSVQRAFIGLFCHATVMAGNGSGLNILENDLITAGANAIRLVGIYVQGADGATVMDNNIGNLESATAESDRGIWFATGTVNSVAAGNNIANLLFTGTTGFAPSGIFLSPNVANANIDIRDNIISGIASAGTLQPTGINFGFGTTNTMIRGNQISNIKNTNTGGFGAAGIALSSTSATAATSVYNNFISDVAGFGFVGNGLNDNGYGIIVTSGAGYDIDYNTVHINTDQSVNGLPAAFNVTTGVTAPGAINLRNNIFANSQTVGTERYAILSAAPASVYGTIDFNDYHTNGPNLGFLGTNQADLTAWQAASGQDANSLSVLPVFVSPTDLHLNTGSNSLLDGAATPLAGVPTDIDGDTRSATIPDIGGDEFISTGPCTGQPDPGNTLSSSNPVCPSTIFTLSLSNSPLTGSGIDYQWQSSPDGSTWTDITGANSSTYNTTQAAATWYQCVVTCTASSQMGTSTPLQILMDAVPNCYCAAEAIDTDPDFEKIALVEFNTINNTSTSANGYEDFTSVSTTVNTGATYPITVTLSNPFISDQVIVWIDYNQDGDFGDAGEEVFVSSVGLGPYNGNITISNSATVGTTRMRIRLHDTANGPNATPCGTSDWGQVEDYTLIISSCTPLTWYEDMDNDTYGNPSVIQTNCVQPVGYVADNTDCDDTNMAINPGAIEICDNVDNDCSGAPEALTNTWNGLGNGTTWDDGANWSDNIVPLTCQNVVIPAPFDVTVPAAFEGKGLTLDVQTGAVLTMALTGLLTIQP